ncbi:hypothetical protein [Streptomyces pinistramenti]|uniref:hypothetical protein n=1 Tax=Streptomyces pinistramenti TaxID=2884812 RepID=UPI001D07EBC6|nr:hypothetical protein [Streptomyces pinistramenti]MCB5907651.1 hypothetical protein [Streptomyces pinistramenti]
MTALHADGALRPTAGALRLIEERAVRPKTVDVAGYVRAVSAHCPYLAPSMARGLTGWTVYEIAGDAESAEAEVFHAGVQAAEWVRPLTTRSHGALVCENIVLLGGDGVGPGELMAWPHWALKNLYGPVGLMFGKFWAGEQGSNRYGRSIPAPPFSFLPVRVAVRPRDPRRFLSRTPELAVAVARAVDDGREVFRDLSQDWKVVRPWAKQLLT